MPSYGFRCPKCEREYEIKISLAEYDELKNQQKCEDCFDVHLVRTVSRPVVHFVGGGWYDQGYGITQMEMNSNLEDEKRIEEKANKMREDDMKRSEY